MNNPAEILKYYLLGRDAERAKLFSVAEKYFEQTVNNSKFEKFMPPHLKVSVLCRFANVKILLGKTDQAKKYALQAVEQNYDLDKTVEDWPDYEFSYSVPPITTNRISHPYRVLGDVYLKLNDFTNAKEAYQNALNINSGDARAIKGLWFIESHFCDNVFWVDKNAPLKDVLAQKSPWIAAWELTDSRFGTFKMSFDISSQGSLVGKIFDSSVLSPSGDISNMVIRGKCFSFNFFGSNTYHDYCLMQDGSLKGTFKIPQLNREPLHVEVAARPIRN